MKFKSQLVSQVSGSVGGLVGARNAYGMYFRARTLPVNPNTPAQVLVRGAMTAAHEAWQALSEAVKSQWDGYAKATPLTKNGTQYTITGLAMFLRAYIQRTVADVAIPADPPDEPGLTDIGEITATVVAATKKVSIAFDNTKPWAANDNGVLLVSVSDLISVNVNYFTGPFRYIGKIEGATATPPTSPVLLDDIHTRTAGQIAMVRVIAQDHKSRLSQEYIFRVTVS